MLREGAYHVSRCAKYSVIVRDYDNYSLLRHSASRFKYACFPQYILA